MEGKGKTVRNCGVDNAVFGNCDRIASAPLLASTPEAVRAFRANLTFFRRGTREEDGIERNTAAKRTPFEKDQLSRDNALLRSAPKNERTIAAQKLYGVLVRRERISK